MGKVIVDAQADEKGNIKAVKFRGNRSFTPIGTAIKMAEQGQIDNAHAVNPRRSAKYLRSNPNSATQDNLDDLAKH